MNVKALVVCNMTEADHHRFKEEALITSATCVGTEQCVMVEMKDPCIQMITEIIETTHRIEINQNLLVKGKKT